MARSGGSSFEDPPDKSSSHLPLCNRFDTLNAGFLEDDPGASPTRVQKLDTYSIEEEVIPLSSQ